MADMPRKTTARPRFARPQPNDGGWYAAFSSPHL